MYFSDKLIEQIEKKGTPIVVGLDPVLDRIPQGCSGSTYDWIRDRRVQQILAFCEDIIDVIHDLVPAVKLQIAFFERYGAVGIEAYQDLCCCAREHDLLIIGDIKRSDIGSTCEAYADGHLGILDRGIYHLPGELEVDAVTLNPYLGTDTISPFLKRAERLAKGLFVLVKTTNPSSGDFQDLLVDGKPLYEHVGLKVNDWGSSCIGESGYSSVGAVVGLTYPDVARQLRELMPKSIFLVPGYGVQGGSLDDLAPFFNKDGLGALVAASRSVMYAYRNPDTAAPPEMYKDAARAEVIKMRRMIAALLASK